MTVDKSERRVRAMFGEIARRYDFLNHALSGGTDVYWRWRAVRAAGSPGDRDSRDGRSGDGPILDVCTGTGDLAIALRRRYPGVPVVATDFTREMLRLAAPKADRAAAEVTWLEADTQALPFADDTFGLVTVAFGLRNVTDTDRGLREMARVCRPGGTVLVLEFSQPTAPLLGPAYGWYFRNVLPRVGQLLSRNRHSAYRYLPESVGEFPSGRGLAERMETCGLEGVRFTALTLGVATLYLGRKPGGGVSAAERQPAAAVPV